MRNVIFVILIFSLTISVYSQERKDKGKFIEYENTYWNSIKKSVEEFEKEEAESTPRMLMDFSEVEIPTNSEDFNQQWHNAPVAQGWTGTCWSFSATSFLESEIKRIHDKEVKLSEMYTVYWEYVEKAKRFVNERGDSRFTQGSQANAVTRMWSMYGCVPHQFYTGLQEGQEHHSHQKMYNEMNEYLKSVKERNEWNEEIVISTIKDIMNYYMGVPPTKFTYEGKEYTPITFRDDFAALKMDEYIDVLSLLQQGYWKETTHPVPDNWWKSDRYKNVPLEDYMSALKSAVESGYTMFIGGDVSEGGYSAMDDVAMVPSYDIPSNYIDDYARQFRFSNKSTSDDHGIHLVGYKKMDNGYWFLIKDSGSGSRNGKNKGYYFYHEDYVKLKMMNFMVHQSAIKELLEKFQKNLIN